MNNEKALIELGLSKNEAKVYLALLELGLTQSGNIIKNTGLHRMLVYNALESLAGKELVTVQTKNRVKIFQASDPTTLKEKVKKMMDLVNNTIPNLEKLQNSSDDKIVVKTLVGKEGLISNLQNLIYSASMQKNRTMCIIGGAKDTDAYEAIGDWYADYTNMLEEKCVKKRLLAPAGTSKMFNEKFVKEKGTELRTLPHGLTSPTYTRITEEIVSIEMYKPKITVIQITNKTIARSYLDSFDLLWNTAKPGFPL